MLRWLHGEVEQAMMLVGSDVVWTLLCIYVQYGIGAYRAMPMGEVSKLNPYPIPGTIIVGYLS